MATLMKLSRPRSGQQMDGRITWWKDDEIEVQQISSVALKLLSMEFAHELPGCRVSMKLFH